LNWEDLANVLEVPIHEQSSFRDKRKCEDLWGWLVERNRLEELPEALRIIKREDLAKLLEESRKQISPQSNTHQRLPENTSLANALPEKMDLYGGEPADLTALVSGLANLAESQMTTIRDHFRAGRRGSALKALQNLKEQIFLHSTPTIKAQLLRLEATLRLAMDDSPDDVEALAVEARLLSPHQEDRLLSIRLVDSREGSQSALDLLGEPRTFGESLFFASKYLELDQFCKVQKWLSGPSHNAFLNAETGERLPFQRAETNRLLALAYLFDREPRQALVRIEQAVEEDPRSEGVRFAQGIVYYYCAFSPSLIPNRLMPFPQPPGQAFVLDSKVSQDYLNRAAALFCVLSQNQETHPTYRRTIEGWYLGTLASHPGKRQEAIALCQQWLNQDPTHPEAIIFNSLEGFGLSMKRTVETLERRLEEQKATDQEVLSLIWLRFQEAHPKVKRLAAVLEKSRSILDKAGLVATWHYWDILRQAYDGQVEEALERVNILESERQRLVLEIKIRELVARKTGKWRPVAESLMRLSDAFNDGTALFSACKILVDAQEWEMAAERIDAMVRRVATSEAVDLAAVVLWHQNSFQNCLSLVDEHWHFFPPEGPPSRVRWIRTQCLRHLGQAPAAIREMENLYRGNPTAEHALSLFNQYVETGDLKNAVILARDRWGAADTPVDVLLYAARMIRQEDAKLAKNLLLRAIDTGITDGLVLSALGLCFDLGTSEEVRNALSVRLPQVAATPGNGVSTLNIHNINEFINDLCDREEKTIQSYRQGFYPLHAMCSDLNLSMPLFYHRAFLGEKLSVGTHKLELFIRHGSCTLQETPITTEDNRILFLDITALLLADHLDLLDLVEKHFQPLAIAADLQLTLMQMRNQFTPSGIGSRTIKDEERNTLMDQLGQLMERLRSGIMAGRYRLIPITPEQQKNNNDEHPQRRNSLLDRVLSTLAGSLPPDEKFWVWCDDRFISSFPLCSVHQPIVGILEILSSLAASGHLSQTQRFHLLHRLRTAQLFYLPLETEEIVHLVCQAPFLEECGELQETEEMVTLRHYIALIQTLPELLQQPEVVDGCLVNQGEWPILVNLMPTVTRSFFAIWQNNEFSEKRRVVLMEWVWNNLSITHFPARYKGTNSSYPLLVIAGLFKNSIIIHKDYSSHLHGYFHWIHYRFLLKKSWIIPDFMAKLAESIKAFALSVCLEDDLQDVHVRRAWAFHVWTFIQALPVPLRQEFLKDPAFFDQMGTPIHRFLTIGSHRFELGAFVQSVADTVTHKQADVLTLAPERHLMLEIISDPDGKEILALREENGHLSSLTEWHFMLSLFSSNLTDRVNFLSDQRSWFDCPAEKFTQVIADLATIEDHSRRKEQVDIWRQESLEIFYQELWERITEGNHVELSPQRLLPPSGKRWLWFMRLEIENGNLCPFARQWEAASKRLIREEGLETAMERLIGLPVALPESLFEALAELGKSERDHFLLNRADAASVPMDRIHLLRLFLHFNVSDRSDPAKGAWIDLFQSILSPSVQEAMRAYLVIVQWTSAAILPWPEATDWPVEIRLAFAWSHSRRLYVLQKRMGVTDSTLESYFSQSLGIFKSALLSTERKTEIMEAAHPRNVGWENLLLSGLGHALECHWDSFCLHGDLIQQLKNIAILNEIEMKDIPMPVISALLDITLAENRFSSFIGHDSLTDLLGKLQKIKAEGSWVEWPRNWRNIFRDDVLTLLEQGSKSITHWLILGKIQGTFPLPAEVLFRIPSLLLKTDLPDLCRQDPFLGSHVLYIAASLNLRCREVEHSENINLEECLLPCFEAIIGCCIQDVITHEITEISESNQKKESNIEGMAENGQDKFEANGEEALLNLFNATWIISTIPDDLDGSVAKFGLLIGTLCERYAKELAPLWRPILGRLVEDMPTALGVYLTKPLLILRSM